MHCVRLAGHRIEPTQAPDDCSWQVVAPQDQIRPREASSYCLITLKYRFSGHQQNNLHDLAVLKRRGLPPYLYMYMYLQRIAVRELRGARSSYQILGTVSLHVIGELDQNACLQHAKSFTEHAWQMWRNCTWQNQLWEFPTGNLCIWVGTNWNAPPQVYKQISPENQSVAQQFWQVILLTYFFKKICF